jgi:hypothetical protein
MFEREIEKNIQNINSIFLILVVIELKQVG